MASTALRSAALALFCSGAAHAQLAPPQLEFVVDTAASSFNFSGSTSLGPLQGNPATFSLQGNQAIVVGSAPGQPVATARFEPGGAASVVGSIQATIPNPVPFLPALAQISIDNLSFVLSSGTFNVGTGGAFSTMGDVTIVSGMITVTPLIGAATQTDLTGNTSAGQSLTGTLLQAGSTLTATSLQNSAFMFMDPASGISATINLAGTLVADHACAAPTVFCTSNPNSTGQVAATQVTGSTRLQDQSLVLDTTGLPQSSAGFYVLSDTPGMVANPGGSQGILCLGGTILRLSNFIQNSGTAGSVALPYPYGQGPGPDPFDPGEAWHFQYWFRDAVGGAPTSNFSDAVRVVFCP